MPSATQFLTCVIISGKGVFVPNSLARSFLVCDVSFWNVPFNLNLTQEVGIKKKKKRKFCEGIIKSSVSFIFSRAQTGSPSVLWLPQVTLFHLQVSAAFIWMDGLCVFYCCWRVFGLLVSLSFFFLILKSHKGDSSIKLWGREIYTSHITLKSGAFEDAKIMSYIFSLRTCVH